MYPIIREEDSEIYSFKPISGLTYEVEFQENTYFFEDYFSIKYLAYFVEINPLQKNILHFPPPDIEISETVAEIIKRFFENNPAYFLTFSTESKDGKQAIRARKFNAWFMKHNDDSFLKIDKTVSTAKHRKFYTSLIVKKDNPLIINILEAFHDITSGFENEK
jgi:hypothetical protein